MDKNKINFDSYNAEARRDFIFKLISSDEIIKSNNDIVKICKKSNYNISQSTVNRDLNILKISKSKKGIYVLDAAIEKKRIDKELSELFSASDSDICYPSSFFNIVSKEGYETLVAKKIKDTFSDRVLGTMVGNGIITIFAEDDEVCKSLRSEIKELMKHK